MVDKMGDEGMLSRRSFLQAASIAGITTVAASFGAASAFAAGSGSASAAGSAAGSGSASGSAAGSASASASGSAAGSAAAGSGAASGSASGSAKGSGSGSGSGGPGAGGPMMMSVTPDPDNSIFCTGDWLGEEPAMPDTFDEEIDVDVCVVGGGISGVAAARAAADEGASVALIEKASTVQGRSSDMAVVNGSINESIGRPTVDPVKIVNELCKECSFKNKQTIINKWANTSGDAFDWFTGANPDLYFCKSNHDDIPDDTPDYVSPWRFPEPEAFDNDEELYPSYNITFNFANTLVPTIQMNLSAAEQTASTSGKDFKEYFGYFAKRLIHDDSGVTGVVAQKYDTDKGDFAGYLKVNAKAVVLATGDYGGDETMRMTFVPKLASVGNMCIFPNSDVAGNQTNTGDGHKMGVWAGGMLQYDHAPMTHNTGGALGPSSYLLIDKTGQRFCNEDMPGQQVESQIDAREDSVAYQIIDGGWADHCQYMPASHQVKCYYWDGDLPKNNPLDSNYAFSTTMDSLTAYDTIDDLLASIDGMDVDTAKATIEHYNELCAAGADTDFGKQAKHLFPLGEDNGPFYYVTYSPTVCLVCMGGLRSDADNHVLDHKGYPIPGLYACGNVQGDRFTVDYPICIAGISHSSAMVLGRNAGISAANLI